MKVFAIKHKPSGEWMPHRMNRAPGGWSHWTPGAAEDKPHDMNPRLFFTLQSARNALTMWLQGKWERHQGTNHSYFDGPEDYDNMIVNTPSVPRCRGDMEIVELELRGAR